MQIQEAIVERYWMIADISNRLARLLAARDFEALEKDDECRRALGVILLERHRKGQSIAHYDAVARFALFRSAHHRAVSLMTLTWPSADWGSPKNWPERFYE